MFNLAAAARHGQAAIAHGVPVSVRIPAIGMTPAGPIFAADFGGREGKLIPVAGGVLYDRGGTLEVSKADYNPAIKENTSLEMLLPGNVWKSYKVEAVWGTENPQVTEVRINIVPPRK